MIVTLVSALNAMGADGIVVMTRNRALYIEVPLISKHAFPIGKKNEIIQDLLPIWIPSTGRLRVVNTSDSEEGPT